MAGCSQIPSSFDRLLLAFANLESYGIDTRILPGSDPAEKLTRLRASILEAFPKGTASCVFLLIHDVDCFDPTGALRRPVPLHHSGADVITAVDAALAEVGLGIDGHAGLHTARVVDLYLDPVELSPESAVPRLHQ